MTASARDQTSELVRQGSRCLGMGDFDGAADCFTRAIHNDPVNALAYHKRGWACACKGDIDGEINDWSKAIELDPTFDAAYADRGVALAAKGDFSGAAADWKRALAINPRRAPTLQPLLDRMTMLADHEDAPDGVERRGFLRLLAGAGLAAAALTHVGCTTRPIRGGRRWGMIIDLRRCVACKSCTIACKNENKTPPGVAYGVFLEEERGEFPNVSRVAFFRPCMQCTNSSCAKVCPTSATYHRPDGIVAVDYEKCIGCRYCIAACPYGARSFDFGHEYIEDGQNPFCVIPSSEYGARYGARKKGDSPIGNVRKCMFCLHLQDEKGEYREPPACVRTCMAGAIHFGDLNDPQGHCIAHGEKLQELLARRAHQRLKEELGNEPSVYYLT